MNDSAEGKRILLIALEDRWRNESKSALGAEGFNVDATNNYSYLDPEGDNQDVTYDLVILGCADIGRDERTLIERVLDNREHLLVLISKFSWPRVRSVFLAGASDVANRPLEPSRLVEVVNQALKNMGSRDNYERIERGGL